MNTIVLLLQFVTNCIHLLSCILYLCVIRCICDTIYIFVIKNVIMCICACIVDRREGGSRREERLTHEGGGKWWEGEMVIKL